MLVFLGLSVQYVYNKLTQFEHMLSHVHDMLMHADDMLTHSITYFDDILTHDAKD